MRLIIAKRHGRRGEGLGNEILPWAKGWIASQALRANLVGPSWGLNKRRYYRNFRTSRLDFLLEDGLLRLPHYDFSEKDYRATAEVDFGTAIGKWADALGLQNKDSFIVSVGGMWGGYSSIRTASSFLLARLATSRDALRNVYQMMSAIDRNKLFIAVHMRSEHHGFYRLKERESARGKFNILIPCEWYLWVCEKLQERYGDRAQFHFFTDRGGADFEKAVSRFNSSQAPQSGLTECSDLLLMAKADLRVCSISSYSLAASFLSGGPYLWYEPQLTERDGLYTLWGNEAAQQPEDSLSSQSTKFVSGLVADRADGEVIAPGYLGTAMDIGDPLPDSLVRLLDQRLQSLDARTNLLEYGCLPKDLM